MLAGVTVGCRVLLAVIFGSALIGKLSSRAALHGFTDSLTALPWWSKPWHPVFAIVILAAEAASAVLMIVPGTALAGLAIAAGLLAGFTIVPAASLKRGIMLTCRCFGLRSATIGPSHVVRNGIALTAAVAGIAASQASGATAAWTPFPVGVGVLCGAIFVGWDEIAYLLRSPARVQDHHWRVRP
ncbi:MAG: MauE/DoxX family redox-associated membrane protein [Streptosporangiaceae bacterium]